MAIVSSAYGSEKERSLFEIGQEHPERFAGLFDYELAIQVSALYGFGHAVRRGQNYLCPRLISAGYTLMALGSYCSQILYITAYFAFLPEQFPGTFLFSLRPLPVSIHSVMAYRI